MSRDRIAASAGLLGVAGLGATALWWRRHPSACPYNQRFWVELPHPFITRARLREALEPRPGERILEVGPGTGYYSLAVAEWIAPDGALELLDIQREMLDHTLRRAREQGLANVSGSCADAQALPFPDEHFDAAYIVAALGEIPDQGAALRELRRVLKPEGRLVVGEIALDPHAVFFDALTERAESAGLRLARRVGGRIGYFARFAPA